MRWKGLSLPSLKRIPQHIGIIPDGNRRWAEKNGLTKEKGYHYGINPGFALYELALELGIPEMTFYGFTVDNTKRPSKQTKAFQNACIDAVKMLSNHDASLLVVGNDKSPLFPEELKTYTSRKTFGRDLIKINFLVNYDWHWDLAQALEKKDGEKSRQKFKDRIGSSDVSRIDLIIRWGGRRRLSGLLPVQSVYSDFYILEDYWPDFQVEHFYQALKWYEQQDITLGG